MAAAHLFTLLVMCCAEATAASAPSVQHESLCRAAATDPLPSSLGDIVGIADNVCCHFYIASSPAAITDVPLDQETGKITLGRKSTNVIPADLSASLGSQAKLGDLGMYALQIYAPVSNVTHGAVMIVSTSLKTQKVSAIVKAPLAWVAVDYATELVYAGSRDATELFVFQAEDLQAKGTLQLKTAVKNIAGAALKEPFLVYVASSNGGMEVVNVTSGDVARIGGIKLSSDSHVLGLANIWGYGKHGSFHFATSEGLEHYDDCSTLQSTVVAV
jgi:hypothetical protein